MYDPALLFINFKIWTSYYEVQKKISEDQALFDSVKYALNALHSISKRQRFEEISGNATFF